MTDAVVRRPDTDKILGTLKDFQRDTVDCVFRKMYPSKPEDMPAYRFLVADEVGLGKTLVARGLVAKIVDHLWDDVGRIDVIYVCSNSDIARQNINRLNIDADAKVALASRLTLLPVTLPDISKNKLNFVAFTPSTSFDPRSSEGIWQERALLYHLLREAWDFRNRKGPLRALQGWVGSYIKWKQQALRYGKDHPIDSGLKAAFVAALKQYDEDRHARGEIRLRDEFEAVADRLARRDWTPNDAALKRARVVGMLRHILATTCLSALEPDLVILDEFQRFRNLLRGEDDERGGSEVAELARTLFDYRSADGHAARVLLLSATPYKMYTRQVEAEEDHYRDFLEIVDFLHGNTDRSQALRQHIADYRSALFRLTPATIQDLQRAKDAIEADLRAVMVRNERQQAAGAVLPMLAEVRPAGLRLSEPDLHGFIALDALAGAVGAGDAVEYWKSAPYLANCMDDGYVLKRQIRRAIADSTRRQAVHEVLGRFPNPWLRWSDIEAYQRVDPANARLRALIDNELEAGWQLLWLPPSLPYYSGDGPFREQTAQGLTKALAFSSWKVVPKVIAMLASLEAERRIVQQQSADLIYSQLHQRRRPLLRFAIQEMGAAGHSQARADLPNMGSPDDQEGTYGRLAGMPVLALLYPCATLARLVDPLVLTAEIRDRGDDPTWRAVVDAAAERLRPLVEDLVTTAQRSAGGPPDVRWYWSALAQIDGRHSPGGTVEWLGLKPKDERYEKLAWSSMVRAGPDENRSVFDFHVDAFREHLTAPKDLSRPPSRPENPDDPDDFSDLTRMLALIALASPAVCMLRALMRLWPAEDIAGLVEAHAAAARVALAFRSLYNLPDTISLIRGQDLGGDEDRTPYWQLTLRYALHGNLQAVLDEYVHVLRDTLGLFDGSSADHCVGIAAAVAEAVSIRTVRLEFDEIDATKPNGAIELIPRTLRCRYAMRFGSDISDDGSETTREDQVRMAFNSPFRPFVLATTSIGQEGLDFHWYCHRIYHWNLPSNPVDLEQREGRIDRYKGHAIRRNIAIRHGPALFDELVQSAPVAPDPWQRMFDMARSRPERPANANELDPWWVYHADGGVSVERCVPALPLSRDEAVLAELKNSLVAYRLVFGQVRQEDLLVFLRKVEAELGLDLDDVLARCRIDLSAPRC